MSEDHKRKLETLATLLIVLALLVPAAFGNPRAPDGTGGDPVRNFLFDFQTLITGILAILAARWTVSQMRTSDLLQERRHREARSDASRATMLAARRLKLHLPKRLRTWSKSFGRYSSNAAKRTAPVTIFRLEEALAVKHMRQVEEALNSSLVRDCMAFFSPEVSEVLYSCRQHAVDIAKVYKNNPVIGAKLRVGEETSLKFYTEALATSCAQLADMIDQWATEIEFQK